MIQLHRFRKCESIHLFLKVHHLFVKVPPKRTAKFERMVRRNRTLEHEVKVSVESMPLDVLRFHFLLDLESESPKG